MNMKAVSFAAVLASAIAADNAAVLAADMPTKARVAEQAESPWMIRLRALVVDPRNSVEFDQLPGTGAAWNTTVVPELDIT